MIETEVLIVGSGPAGSASALALASAGIKCMVVTRYGWLANTPRAHITNQRAMEFFRDMGVEEQVKLYGTPQNLMGNNVFCESIAGDELGRLYSWGNHPNRMADYTLASPTSHCDCPQDLLEPILIGKAAERGAKIRFSTEYLSLKQDANGVTATVRDRIADKIYTIRAKYLIGADGGRSQVAEDIGLKMHGKMGVGGSINIIINADLSRYIAHRPSVLYWVLQPGSDVGGIGMGLVRMVRPWNEWLLIWGYDISKPPPKLTEKQAISIAHSLIGDSSIPIKLRSISLWTVNHMYAKTNTVGRVFCMGDATHRHPPSNGLGSNTSISDAYNLAWKLGLVVRDKADPKLLDSYNAERAPIAKQIVDRANKSIAEFGPIFESLGLLNTQNVEQMKKNIASRKQATPKAAVQREKLRKAILYKSYEFNCHGVEMNQRYKSNAIVADGSADPGFKRDRELYYQASTRPGAHLPHVWIENEKTHQKISIQDLAGKGRFCLFTSLGGKAWISAAAAVAKKSGIEIASYTIGPGCGYRDLYGDWPEAREVQEDGCLLVRPDCFVAWRSKRKASSASAATKKLNEVMNRILGRS